MVMHGKRVGYELTKVDEMIRNLNIDIEASTQIKVSSRERHS